MGTLPLGTDFNLVSPLFAYADPGSGMLFWQLLVAGFAGLMFYLRRLLRWRRNNRDEEKGQDTSTDGE